MHSRHVENWKEPSHQVAKSSFVQGSRGIFRCKFCCCTARYKESQVLRHVQAFSDACTSTFLELSPARRSLCMSKYGRYADPKMRTELKDHSSSDVFIIEDLDMIKAPVLPPHLGSIHICWGLCVGLRQHWHHWEIKCYKLEIELLLKNCS